ncbi:hypothetical protein C1J03_02945 [Sulfitobacter sp. SK012]|uniref:DUF6473 family protein n=1 Tax=Sulfitobacter sp. SK012 TaxID=1389005 RepID=UPI000E0B764E|nr:DUF6473 family protein [Sulfitobacter sp. SK012]AXI45082.1 hypothetical protein C1J03_02945 [Sulfitobacter sp. SK012]
MSYGALGPGALDYLPCRYGTSKLLFRGPRRSLDSPYVAFLGGTETYGKFITQPFADRVEEGTGIPSVNFGCLNAGIDVFAHDPFVIGAASKARVSVVQVLGAANMTNRFYSVHPRRNDRFIGASKLLSTIYSDVDFAEFHFTKHMLNRLLLVSPARFESVQTELQQAWVARMRLLLGQIGKRTILLWFAQHAPGNDLVLNEDGELGQDPLFVTREMMDQLADCAAEVVEVPASPSAIEAGNEGMVYDELETSAASEMLGPVAHQEVADRLIEPIKRMM